ncbi:N-acetylmuramoyl-L-alanine amidase family protein [Leeuwenhoekiella parthenopeia]|uniref:N-acetylmuramoyl-L-alanine amidase n=1 Tax=Leeuwenhoekiella parthenopeia TaxID=2890320 RepID=A0ABS8GUW9_9FLAO|nr:N-acetylmuramoyl-L-alanine amidase [Leeuwenhoekiella parthenopeia]MCC4213799.1 N-acetylmuramoyl-L-alanine amidase [Leeuwenhoekiella parthenopeia]
MRTIITYLLVFIVFAYAKTSYANLKPVDLKKFVVVIDAGHGGHDPGKNTKSGIKEKDIALKIALLVGDKLKRDRDIEVIYTRKTDVFIGLEERGHIANRAKADLFISIHCNAHNTQASGAESYVLGLHRNQTNLEVAKAENEVIFLEDNYKEKYAQYNLNAPESLIGLTLMQEEFLDQSIQLASYVQDNFREKLKRKDRSVKQAGFVVLHQTVMPSILIETGFITNTEEGRYLNSSKGQEEIAGSIADAVINYKDNVRANDFLPVQNELPVAQVEDVVVEDAVFRVQIAASSRDLEPKAYNFKGLSPIEREKEGKLYKYYYGNTSNYSEIQRKLSEAQAKGYKTAYIVAFKNGIKRNANDFINKS